TLPPLRERREDIPALVEHFARQVAEQNGWKPGTIAPEAMQRLQAYSWPGNVRELRNAVERLLLFATNDQVTIDSVRMALPADRGTNHHAGTGTLSDQVRDFEREVILAELERQQHHVTNTAKALGLERSHLYKKCQQLGIDLHSARGEGAS
ncbi:MAG TPA: helix-turn-helix domain-containing protein, partial [Terriglobales bacterium]|nr:helix-turn-helix domain-containing protein [Terriglobales bacterium]